MKKINKIFPILILVILIVATLVLSSCDFGSTNTNNGTNPNQTNPDDNGTGNIERNDNDGKINPNDNTTYTLTFMVDGTEYQKVQISTFTDFKMPEDPQKEGYEFEGWYLDENVWKTPFEVDSLRIILNRNLIIYARFIYYNPNYSGIIGAQKPISLTPNTSINSEMTSFEMMNAALNNYYEAEYAANMCVKGGVKTNSGPIHVNQCVNSLKVRAGKSSDTDVQYFNYSKSWGIALMNEEYFMKTDGSIIYRKAKNIKKQNSADGKSRISNGWEEAVKYSNVEVFKDHTSIDFTKIWQFVLNEQTIKSESKNIKPEYNEDGGYYTFKIAVDVNNELSIADYKKVIEYQIASKSGMKVESIIFTNLELEFCVWENGFIRYVDVHEVFVVDLYNIPVVGRVSGMSIENNYMNEYSFDKNENIPYDTCETNERVLNLSFEALGLLINEQGAVTIAKEGDFVIYSDGGLKELISYKGSSTEITIPNGVTSIGSGAFDSCFGLTNITIPSSVTSIGNNAFSRCYRLVEVYNKSSITINKEDYGLSYVKNIYTEEGGSKLSKEGDYVIYIDGELKELIRYDGTVTEITIPSSVTSIGENAFYGCSSLTNITIPSSVTSIGENAFYGCSSLTNITIPDSVTSIGESAFDNCSGLTSITIPSSITSIGAYAFSGCNNLQYNEYEGIKYLGNESNPYLYLAKIINITQSTYTIHNDTKIIGDLAFHSCYNLTSITIPNSVTSIGEYAFYGCSSLTNITIPSSVTSIGENAFYECSSLTIYCKATSEPSGWDSWWNYSECSVYWYSETEPIKTGNYWHYVDGVVTKWQ